MYEHKIKARCPHCQHILELSKLSQYAFSCTECDEDFLFFEVDFTSEEEKNETLIAMWEKLDDAPYDPDTETFKKPFYGIGETDEPLSKLDVWHWFDNRYTGLRGCPGGVAALVYHEYPRGGALT